MHIKELKYTCILKILHIMFFFTYQIYYNKCPLSNKHPSKFVGKKMAKSHTKLLQDIGILVHHILFIPRHLRQAVP